MQAQVTKAKLTRAAYKQHRTFAQRKHEREASQNLWYDCYFILHEVRQLIAMSVKVGRGGEKAFLFCLVCLFCCYLVSCGEGGGGTHHNWRLWKG